MMHPYSPGAVESDVMLCVICALLAVIAIHNVVLQHPNTIPSGGVPSTENGLTKMKQDNNAFAATITTASAPDSSSHA
jgi:hypothetical protein